MIFKKNIVHNTVSKMNKLDYYFLSFAGRRKNNQDACIVLKPSNNSIFLAVADGMGGAAGGEVASRAVLDTAERVLKKKFADEVQPEELKDILKGILFAWLTVRIIASSSSSLPLIPPISSLNETMMSIRSGKFGSRMGACFHITRENLFTSKTEYPGR